MFRKLIPARKRFIYGIVVILLIGIAAFIWLRPPALALYHQVQGGMILAEVIRTYQQNSPNSLACEVGALASDSAHARLKQAIAHLEQARKYNPNLSQDYLLLGRAFCMLGKPKEAVNVLLKYTYLRPKNPLGFLELGFAYGATCRYQNNANENPPNQGTITGVQCQNQDFKTRIAQSWKASGINPEQMYDRADLAFASQQYDIAGSWFELAMLLGGKPDGRRQFEWAVSDVLVGQPLPGGLDANAVSVYTLSGDVMIGGENLQWMRPEAPSWNIRYGQRLDEHPSGEPGVGVLWWQGSGVAIVHASCATEYRIDVRAMHKSAAGLAGQLQVEIDLTPVANITLSEDWQVYDTSIILTKGDHVLGIRYVEDVGDAFINWVSIGQMKDCSP